MRGMDGCYSFGEAGYAAPGRRRGGFGRLIKMMRILRLALAAAAGLMLTSSIVAAETPAVVIAEAPEPSIGARLDKVIDGGYC
jgi:hypothetical protein